MEQGDHNDLTRRCDLAARKHTIARTPSPAATPRHTLVPPLPLPAIQLCSPTPISANLGANQKLDRAGGGLAQGSADAVGPELPCRLETGRVGHVAEEQATHQWPRRPGGLGSAWLGMEGGVVIDKPKKHHKRVHVSRIACSSEQRRWRRADHTVSIKDHTPSLRRLPMTIRR